MGVAATPSMPDIEHRVTSLFSLVDTDGSHQLEKEEIIDVLSTTGEMRSDHNVRIVLKSAFEDMDVNHDGKVSITEWNAFFNDKLAQYGETWTNSYLDAIESVIKVPMLPVLSAEGFIHNKGSIEGQLTAFFLRHNPGKIKEVSVMSKHLATKTTDEERERFLQQLNTALNNKYGEDLTSVSAAEAAKHEWMECVQDKQGKKQKYWFTPSGESTWNDPHAAVAVTDEELLNAAGRESVVLDTGYALAGHPKYTKFIEKLTEKGFFEGHALGTQEYNERLDQAHASFTAKYGADHSKEVVQVEVAPDHQAATAVQMDGLHHRREVVMTEGGDEVLVKHHKDEPAPEPAPTHEPAPEPEAAPEPAEGGESKGFWERNAIPVVEEPVVEAPRSSDELVNRIEAALEVERASIVTVVDKGVKAAHVKTEARLQRWHQQITDDATPDAQKVLARNLAEAFLARASSKSGFGGFSPRSS